MDKLMKQLSINLKKIRKDHNLKQHDLSKILEIDTQSYGSYERGDYCIPLKNLIKLRDFYNCSLDDFFMKDYKKKDSSQYKDALTTAISILKALKESCDG